MDARFRGYLQRILTARVFDVTAETPLEQRPPPTTAILWPLSDEAS